jgi:hypothetical protein
MWWILQENNLDLYDVIFLIWFALQQQMTKLSTLIYVLINEVVLSRVSD